MIAILDTEQADQAQAIAALANRCDLPIVKPANSAGFSYFLAWRSLNYQQPSLALFVANNQNQPLLDVDLDNTDIQRRIKGGRKQLLAKAIGLNRHNDLTVIDATAGLGRDAATLAALGCRVHMLERHPVIYSLLEDALKRLSAPWATHLSLDFLDAAKQSTATYKADIKPDVIYLDPMYQPTRKAALPGKELQVLRELVGVDADQSELFEQAIYSGAQRITVKRHPKAAALRYQSVVEPDIVFRGNRARYDVYMRKSQWPTKAT